MRRLVIEIKYGGFGDHLFHSHLPRIAKETEQYDEVYISSRSLIRQQDHLELVWKLNPYVDGMVDEEGVSCDLGKLVDEARNNKTKNLLDLVMLSYGLDDGVRWHDPELYYKPKFIEKYNNNIYDPNHFTFIGDINISDLYGYINSNNIQFDSIMKLRGNKALLIPSSTDVMIDAPGVFEFCDVLFSAKNIYCFTSGTATLASALGKKATIFYGEGINTGFHHAKNNTYLLVQRSKKTMLLNWIKKPFRWLKSLLNKK